MCYISWVPNVYQPAAWPNPHLISWSSHPAQRKKYVCKCLCNMNKYINWLKTRCEENCFWPLLLNNAGHLQAQRCSEGSSLTEEKHIQSLSKQWKTQPGCGRQLREREMDSCDDSSSFSFHTTTLNNKGSYYITCWVIVTGKQWFLTVGSRDPQGFSGCLWDSFTVNQLIYFRSKAE